MVLSVYQVNNVLRVYKDQLRQNRGAGCAAGQNRHVPEDRISISAGAKREAIVDKIAADITSRVTKYGPQDALEKEVLKKLKNEYGAILDVDRKDSGRLIFKVIDKEEESINALSIKDSNFMAHKLQEITRETVDRIEQNNFGELTNEN